MTLTAKNLGVGTFTGVEDIYTVPSGYVGYIKSLYVFNDQAETTGFNVLIDSTKIFGTDLSQDAGFELTNLVLDAEQVLTLSGEGNYFLSGAEENV